MPYFNTLQYDVVTERIEREQPDKEGHRLKSLVETFFLQKIMSVWDKDHVSLWEKSCQFVGKIMLVCGKNHVGLQEKSFRFVGKICWSENFTGKYLHKHQKTYRIIYLYLPRYASYNNGKFVET